MRGYCDLCKNTGEIDCYCGGDLCICLNYGTMDCPACNGDFGDDDDLWPEEVDGTPAPKAED